MTVETFAACLVMIPSVMANLFTNLVSLLFVLEVLNILRGIYNKVFTPFQEYAPVFYPLNTSGFVFSGSIK